MLLLLELRFDDLGQNGEVQGLLEALGLVWPQKREQQREVLMDLHVEEEVLHIVVVHPVQDVLADEEVELGSHENGLLQLPHIFASYLPVFLDKEFPQRNDQVMDQLDALVVPHNFGEFQEEVQQVLVTLVLIKPLLHDQVAQVYRYLHYEEEENQR